MKAHRNESGAVIMLIAVFSFVLLILIAIAVDLWNFETDNVRMQTAADAGTLAAGMILAKDLKTDEITAISMQLATEVDMFNNNLGVYARPPLSQAEAELLLDTTLRNTLIGEGIDAGRINTCISNLSPTGHAGVTRPALDNLLRGGIDQNSCIDPTIAGNLTVKLLKEVAQAVGRDNLVHSTYRNDEIDGISLAVLDKNGVATNDPNSIERLGLDVDARTTLFLANHVTGLNVPDNFAREKDAAGQKSQAAIVMLLDISGSMSGQPLVDLKNAAKHFAQQFAASDNALGLVYYHSWAGLLRQLQANFSATEYELAIDGLVDQGCTNIDDAVKFAQVEFGRPVADGKLRVLILITDGIPNTIVGGSACSWVSPSTWNPICRTDGLRGDGIIVYTVGFGNVQPDFLKRTAFDNDSPGLPDFSGNTCTGPGIQNLIVKSWTDLTNAGAPTGEFYQAPDSSQLNTILNAIAAKIKFRLTH